MLIDPSTMIVRDPRAIETTVGSETVLMVIETGECIGLGDTGSEVWQQLAKPTSAATLIERLRVLYDAPQGVIEGDLYELLDTLKAHDLIVFK